MTESTRCIQDSYKYREEEEPKAKRQNMESKPKPAKWKREVVSILLKYYVINHS